MKIIFTFIYPHNISLKLATTNLVILRYYVSLNSEIKVKTKYIIKVKKNYNNKRGGKCEKPKKEFVFIVFLESAEMGLC